MMCTDLMDQQNKKGATREFMTCCRSLNAANINLNEK